jgi:hypothetical protein
MEPHILLTQLKALLARAPDFRAYAPSSMEHQAWLGQAHALVGRWSTVEAVGLKTAADFLGFQPNREWNIGQIFGALHRAVADLELRLPADAGQAFGPGAVYDFFKALNEVLSSAQQSLLIADPFLDDTIFDTYLSSVAKGIAVRLLVGKYAAKVKPAAEKFVVQFEVLIEVRQSQAFHDRLVFVDGDVCWVIGQSIKDAAAAKPTYLAPLAPDVARPKLADYEQIWLGATAI